jgi:DnaJ-class molecular chaperone
MPREPQPAETRVLRVLRQVAVLTGAQLDEARAALEATELCTRCNGTAQEPDGPPGRACSRCDGTGQQRSIR